LSSDKTKKNLLFGQRVRRLRRAKGLTQKALGEKVGVCDAAVVAWERGKNRPGPRHIGPLCKELGASEAQLEDKEPLNKSAEFQTKANVPRLRSALEGARTEIDEALAALDEVDSTGEKVKKPKTKRKAKKNPSKS